MFENQNIIEAGDALKNYERLLLAEAARVSDVPGDAARLYRQLLERRQRAADTEGKWFKQLEFYRGMNT